MPITENFSKDPSSIQRPHEKYELGVSDRMVVIDWKYFVGDDML